MKKPACACGHDSVVAGEGHAHVSGQAHDHAHGHTHELHDIPKGKSYILKRWGLSLFIVTASLLGLRSFLLEQMQVRVTSYAAYGYHQDAIRMCRKIILFDRANRQAWTALGFAYMDLVRTDKAMDVFKHVLALYPADTAAASFQLGQAYFLRHDYGRAITYLERVHRVGSRAGALLDADMLKYRHGTRGFQSVHSYGVLLLRLLECYQKTGDSARAAVIQQEYAEYKNKHQKILF